MGRRTVSKINPTIIVESTTNIARVVAYKLSKYLFVGLIKFDTDTSTGGLLKDIEED